MGLIGKNLSTVTSALTNPQSYVNSLLAKTGAGNLLSATGITNAVSGATSGLLRQATSAAANVLNSIDLSSVASNVSSSLKDLFGNTTNDVMANVKTAIPDSFANTIGKIAPTGGTFLTNPISSQMDALNFGAAKQMAANELSKLDLSSLQATATKLGVAMPKTDAMLGELKKAAGEAVKDSALSGLYSGLKDVSSSLSPVVGTITTVKGEATAMANDLGRFLNTTAPKFGSDSGVDATKLSSYFTVGLPTYTDTSGQPIAGIPKNVDTGLLSGIKSIASDVGVNFSGWGDGINYSAQQNKFNAGFGLAAENGLSSVVSSFASNPQYNSSTKSLAKSLIGNVVGNGDAQMVSQLIDLVGGNGVGGKTSLVKTLINNPNLVDGAIGAVGGVMSKLGVDVEDLFGTGDKIGDKIIWNQPGIKNANQKVTKTIVDPDLLGLTTATKMSKYPDGTIVNWR